MNYIADQRPEQEDRRRSEILVAASIGLLQENVRVSDANVERRNNTELTQN